MLDVRRLRARARASVEREEESISSSFSSTDDNTGYDLNIRRLQGRLLVPERLAFDPRFQTHHETVAVPRDR